MPAVLLPQWEEGLVVAASIGGRGRSVTAAAAAALLRSRWWRRDRAGDVKLGHGRGAARDVGDGEGGHQSAQAGGREVRPADHAVRGDERSGGDGGVLEAQHAVIEQGQLLRGMEGG